MNGRNMSLKRKVAVVMPAYNAEHTLLRSFAEVCEQDVADIVIIVDDCSSDRTAELARTLKCDGVKVIFHRHDANRGYGGNQKTCYRLALQELAQLNGGCDAGGGIVVMVHPDCQYTPKLLPAMASMIDAGLHPCVLASRILGGYALKSGMPWWKYAANRALTFAMNMLMGSKLSEFHTGYRAFTSELLAELPLDENTDDFAFDAQMLAEILWSGATIGEVSCPTVYMPEASSINFRRSCKYGFGCLWASILYRLCRMGLVSSGKFGEVRRDAR